MPLDELIGFLLTQYHEDDFWDVKQEWHENTEDLVKDIICFANTVHDEDCYLIIGVTDDLKVLGIGDNDRRRKLSDINDTLSNLPFAGDNVPKIDIKTILLPSDFEKGKLVEIDVLIIFNSYKTPFFLKSVIGRYNNAMSKGCIYSRIGDKNTPNKGNAETEQIEMLWKKRFGLTKPPLEYILDSLNNKRDWREYDGSWYNIYKPEYVLRLNDDDSVDSDADEFYSYAQVNQRTYFYILDIIANNTVLKHYQLVSLDGGRLLVPVPEWGHLDIRNEFGVNDDYKYYVRGSDRFNLLEFLYNNENSEERWAFSHLKNVVLFFDSEDERKGFEGYVDYYLTSFAQQVEKCDRYDYIDTGSEQRNKVYKRRLHIGVILNKILEEYHKEFPTEKKKNSHLS